MATTAKVELQAKEDPGGAGEGSVTLRFVPDYQDGRNAEWAKYTPALSLVMTVLDSVAGQFEQGGKYTLTIAQSEGDAG